jgi:hypothetical protein
MIEEQKMKGLALYDFHAREADELSLQKGDQFFIVEKFEDGWWLIEMNDEEGVIPSNFVREYNDEDEPVRSSRGKFAFFP